MMAIISSMRAPRVIQLLPRTPEVFGPGARSDAEREAVAGQHRDHAT